MNTKDRRKRMKEQGLIEIHGFFVNPGDKDFFRWLEKVSRLGLLTSSLKDKIQGVTNG